MAAYAALLSVMHIIDALRMHPQPPISLHKKQALLLTQKITFLQEFLEGYNPHLGYTTEADPFEIRIADAAYAAEDAIENHIADHLTGDGEKIRPNALYDALEMVIQEMALIQKEAIEIKETNLQERHQLQTDSASKDSLRSSPMVQKRSMVGVDDALLYMKDKLTNDRRDLHIIPIVGMGGSGKTTLAINIYQDLLIKEHFHICAWATISQEYSILEMLIEVLRQLNQSVDQSMNEDTLGEILYKHLFGRKYLITLDDMWSIEAWDGVRRFLPDNKNGSRLVVTTRLSTLFPKSPNFYSLEMKLLDEAHSWELLSKTVFGEEDCPLELEEIGKEIGKSCKGLPLSIVVVGGLLAKSKHTQEFWKHIEVNLNSIVNSEDNERCLKILHMSYKQLPVYLKPCFLYMGVFPKDRVIHISQLIKLWVAEGFLKPISGKTLEEVAKMYLEGLIGRNLILIDRLGKIGDMKYFKIHDLLRDLCLREAEKERFYATSSQGKINGKRRIAISKNEDMIALSSMSQIRSLTLDLDDGVVLPPLSFRLLRILQSWRLLTIASEEFLQNMHRLVNSRFLKFFTKTHCEFHCSIRQFWNLQTLIVTYFLGEMPTVSTDIWYHPHIRHVAFQLFQLSDPPNGQDDIVLGNLQTLGMIKNFKCNKQVVKRIPNIKQLRLYYDDDGYSLSNLDHLEKLESLYCYFHVTVRMQINFPRSLKKLSLDIGNYSSECWGDIMDKIGVLPLLEKLKLYNVRFEQGQWETTQGQFRSLKLLGLYWCNSLHVWTTETSHFPCLEYLHLRDLNKLEEIPLDFAETSTLGVIHMSCCSDSIVTSAKRILEEQEDLYGEDAALQVRVQLSSKNNEALKSLASHNFRVTPWKN